MKKKLVLYHLLLRKKNHLGAQLAGGGGRGRSTLFCFLKIGKKFALNLEKIALFVCIYGLNSHLKCSFGEILEKKYVLHEVIIKTPLFQETCSALCACNSHPNFSS